MTENFSYQPPRLRIVATYPIGEGSLPQIFEIEVNEIRVDVNFVREIIDALSRATVAPPQVEVDGALSDETKDVLRRELSHLQAVHVS